MTRIIKQYGPVIIPGLAIALIGWGSLQAQVLYIKDVAEKATPMAQHEAEVRHVAYLLGLLHQDLKALREELSRK